MNFIDLDSIASMASSAVTPGPDMTSVTSRTLEASHDGGVVRGPRHANVMLVDDEQSSIEVVRTCLEEQGFSNFVTTTDTSSVLEMLPEHRPDVLLLGIKLPDVDGLQLLSDIRRNEAFRMIPVVILTASTDADDKLKMLRMGASDILAKPVDPIELLLRVEHVLNLKVYQDHLASYSGRLQEQVKLRNEELFLSRQEAILCLARAAEYRDDDTGQHVTRVGRYAAIIANQLGFPKPAVDLLEQAAQLHDIGKIGIPDSILRKPGKLAAEEFTQMKTHCGIGRRIINPATSEESAVMQGHTSLGMKIMSSTTSPVMKMAAVIAETHHEKWDGSGYPKGLAGNQIPVQGRITAVADVFDALSSKRPYKEAFPIDRCLMIINEGRGTQFDPRVLDAFMARQDDIIRVRQDSTQNGNETQPNLNHSSAPLQVTGNDHVQ